MTAPRLQVHDQGRPRTSRAFLNRVVSAALGHVGRPDMEVSLLLTDDAGIGELHGRFLGDPSPTDVISFPMDDGVELVVSVETARRTAAELGHDPLAELALYVVHGILHACGHDDVRRVDREKMRDAERRVLLSLGLQVRAVDP